MKVRETTAHDPDTIQVLRVTEEIFGPHIEVEELVDPADPDAGYVSFTVEMSGELEELLDAEIEWGRRVEEVLPGSLERFRLNLVPTD